jgi:hypothetical protein
MFLMSGPAKSLSITVIVILLLASCTIVKNYPENKPFVYSNKVIVDGIISKDEKKRLQTELQNYWHDSLKVRSISQFGVRTVMKNPTAYDSTYINSSITFMNSYLNSQGYYNGIFKDSADTVKVDNQLRTNLVMNVLLGRNLRIDSFAFDFENTELQQLAAANQNKTFLAKNKDFSKQLISSELDRLVTLFRNNGYFYFTRDNLFADVDTTDLSLLELTLDPFEQASKISEATQRRRLNPTIDVIIRQRNTDSINATKYRVGHVYFYPEAQINDDPDSLINATFSKISSNRKITVKQNEGIINYGPMYEHTFMRRDTMYMEQGYFKTVNSLSQMGVWSQVDAKAVARPGSANVLDFHFFLTPAKKYSFSTELEGSRNTGGITTGNLLGIANNNILRNRNVWQEGIQSSTSARIGVELGFNQNTNPLQTFQASLSQNYSIPRLLTPVNIERKKRLDYYKTVVSFNAAYADRLNFFRLRSLVSSFGYEWKLGNHVWTFRPLNLELYGLEKLRLLDSAFKANPFLRTAFNTGYVAGNLNLTFNKTFASRNRPHISNYLRASVEESGAILGRIKSLSDKIYQYVRTEGEFRQIVKFRKTDLAYRLFGGVGYNYGTDSIIGQTLPFFKQFIAGGPNSMRAWNLRQLGLGSSLRSDTSSSFRDRFGDIQLEGNVEYRFPITTIGGVKLNSAVFADIGNIWNLKSNIDNPMSKLQWDRLFRDLAIGVGTGLRLDFNYFLIRIDFAYKVKDPAREANNGWMSIKDFEWRNKEYNVNSTNGRPLRRNNYAFQLGIGLPF